jgi:hypothetical protein
MSKPWDLLIQIKLSHRCRNLDTANCVILTFCVDCDFNKILTLYLNTDRHHNVVHRYIHQYAHFYHLRLTNGNICRSQLPRGLRRRSAAGCLLGLRVRIPPVAWKSVCCDCCVVSDRGLYDGLVTSPEESYRMWCA